MVAAPDRHCGLLGCLCLGALFLFGALTLPELAQATPQIRSFGFAATEADGEPSRQAGAHPDQVTTSIAFSGDNGSGGPGSPHDLILDLPSGSIGNPTATPTCNEPEFQLGQCSPDSQIGYVKLVRSPEAFVFPLFNLEPLPGVAGEFGIPPPNQVRFAVRVRTGEDYGISIAAMNLSQALRLNEAEVILWGVPADSSHDGFRGECLEPSEPTGELCPSDASPRPLLTNPSTCSPALSVTARVDSWQSRGIFDSATSSNEDSAGDPVGMIGCESLAFDPSLTVVPTVPTPRSPTGLTVELRSPQAQDPGNLAEATLEKAAVTLPEGVAISPPAADGLGACAPTQIRLGDASQPSCPDSSKLGTMTIETPMLDAALSGAVYLAKPEDNPFSARFAIYGVVAGSGVLIKLAGRVDPDPVTGQLRVTFEDSPQLPFSEVEVHLFGGPRAPLSTPPRCGTYRTKSQLTAWGAVAAVAPPSSFELSSGCSEPRFAPSLEAGTLDLAAGSHSPFALRLRRGEKDGEFASRLALDLPLGVSAALVGTTYCPEAALAGNTPQSPICPAASRIGRAVIQAGAGPSPLQLSGEVYLSGPYKGAPLSLAAVVPARAGPFDLGAIVERVAVDVDPRTAQLSGRADPLPQIHDGIPLELRSLTLDLDRPRFMRNPTSCEPMAITGAATASSGRSSTLSAPLQFGGCRALPFKPKLGLHLLGAAGRSGHPALRAVLRAGAGEAGISGATISLPAGELLDLHHVGTICVRQLPPERCPPSSRLGRVRIWSPLLTDPLRGPIYLRTPSSGLPNLLADLRGGGFRFLLHGRAIARNDRLGIRLPALPDVPVAKAVLTLGGGSRGILVNSEALCARPRRATVTLGAHNGKQHQLRPLVRFGGSC